MATGLYSGKVVIAWRTLRGFTVALARRSSKSKATPAPPIRLTISWPLAAAIAILVLTYAVGCSTRIFEQAESLQGTRTEQLRDWVREDPQNHQLIVFVHGFNSNKEAAWGQFPTLLKGDPDFKDFNIHRFGYPTKLCRQVSNIQNQGDLLASFLKEILTAEQPRYRQVVLVGHSMGGLVVLHALLKLERDHLEVLQGKEFKVLTFGTPYLGVENTEALLLFCDNTQANNLSLLNDTLGELGREWTQRFNHPAPSGRETPQVSLYAFRGTEDRFISKASACGYPQIPCESVDGDHSSIVKPIDRTHLAYAKLKRLATQPRVPSTSNDALWMVPDGLSVTINCKPVVIPLTGEPGGLLYAVYLHPQWGNRLVSASSTSWPPWATPNDGAYRCEILNNGKVTLYGLSVVFMVTFREGTALPPKREIAIPFPESVETHRSMVFYIADDTRRAQEVLPPESVSVRVGNEKERRTIPVRYSTIDGHPVALRGFNP